MKTVLCFGDSNTHGFDPATFTRFPRDVRWPGVLRAALGDDVEVIEEGLNGRTACWDDPFCDGRNGRQYLAPCLRTHAPVDLVVLMLGTNDAKTIFRLAAPEIASGVRALLDTIAGSLAGPNGEAPAVLVVAPAPLGDVTRESALWGFGASGQVSRDLATHLETAAGMAGAAFLDAAPVATVSAIDGVHLDAAGHAALGAAVAARVREMLASG